MSELFGSGPTLVDLPDDVLDGEADLEAVKAAFDAAGDDEPRLLRVARCRPTAAFSRRDTLLPGYEAARAATLERGFVPAVRPVGGHLAAYDEGSLVFYLAGSLDDARLGIEQRFADAGSVVRDVLSGLGVGDARVGPVSGEYCDGRFSFNAAGRTKIVGTGQRLRRHAYLFCGVVSVLPSPGVREALVAAYDTLGLPLDPATVGCVADEVPGVGVSEVASALVPALLGLLV